MNYFIYKTVTILFSKLQLCIFIIRKFHLEGNEHKSQVVNIPNKADTRVSNWKIQNKGKKFDAEKRHPKATLWDKTFEILRFFKVKIIKNREPPKGALHSKFPQKIFCIWYR